MTYLALFLSSVVAGYGVFRSSAALLILGFYLLLVALWAHAVRPRPVDEPAEEPGELLDFSNVSWVEFDRARETDREHRGDAA